jgi:hypothetical protein
MYKYLYKCLFLSKRCMFDNLEIELLEQYKKLHFAYVELIHT